MNVIDVTPRPAALSAIVRFLQSRVMTILGILFILTAFKWGTLLFVVHQYETVIITRFGKIVRTITTPGLKMKLPLIDKLQRFDKRILAWEGPPIECPTKDKLYIIVDCFARWRISDPMLYYNRLNDERSALSRLDDILGSETRSAVAKRPGPFCPPQFPISNMGAAKSRNRSPSARVKRSLTLGSNCSTNVSNAANTIRRWRRRLSSACRASDTKSLRDSVPRDAAKRRTLVGKRKATWPRSVLMPLKTRLKSKAKPTPKPRRFTPQLLARRTSRNSIRFCAASM